MPRILIVDDSPTAAAFARGALRSSGHEPLVLGHFVELPNVLRRQPPDLVLLDLNMPSLSGVRFGQFIRQFETSHVPIVIYSAQSRSEIETAAREIGAAGFVEKGCTADELREVVRRALDASAPAPVDERRVGRS